MDKNRPLQYCIKPFSKFGSWKVFGPKCPLSWLGPFPSPGGSTFFFSDSFFLTRDQERVELCVTNSHNDERGGGEKCGTVKDEHYHIKLSANCNCKRKFLSQKKKAVSDKSREILICKHIWNLGTWQPLIEWEGQANGGPLKCVSYFGEQIRWTIFLLKLVF